MTPGSRSIEFGCRGQKGRPSERAGGRSRERCSVLRNPAAFAGAALRPLERSCIPRRRTASSERGCVPGNPAPSPEPGCNPENRAASPQSDSVPGNRAASLGLGAFPRAGLRPQESGCIPGARCFPRTGLQSRCRPPAAQGAGRALTFLLELQLLQHAGFRGSRGRRQRRLRGRRRTRISMGRGDPASLAPGGGACSGGGRARRRERAAGQGGARPRPGRAAAGGPRWHAPLPPRLWYGPRASVGRGNGGPSASSAARASGHARPRAGVGPWAPAAPSAGTRFPLGAPRGRRMAPKKGEAAGGAALRRRFRALSSPSPSPRAADL